MSPMEFRSPPPSIDKIESRIAADLSKKAAIATPVVMIGLGVWRGPDAALAGLLAVAIVVGNLLASAAILGVVARHAPHALTGVALMSFLGRLILITVIGVFIKSLGIADWPVFCFTLLASYFVLLFWELRSISLSLASPGLKPKPGHA